jgi:hypothetical protein
VSEKRDKAFALIGQRNVWETRQRLYYQMRHDGLRRINKPWESAADFHFPLIDMIISAMKPFWVSQIFGGERLTDFIALREQLADMTEAAADYFNFEMRYRTELRYQVERAVDIMLLRGRGVLKIVYDPFTSRIVFRAVDPQYILMEEDFDDFDDADYFVEIQSLTVAQYRRNRMFNQNEEIISKIRGRADSAVNQQKLEKELREGITYSTNENKIILWNYYERTSSGWIVDTRSPLQWDLKDREGNGVRQPYRLLTEWDGEPLQPFYSLTMEIKDEGWFSPRGLAELNAAFETYCTKLWNEKADAMTFSNRPLFTSDQEIQNPGNIRFNPGELLPPTIRRVEQPAPPMDFAEEINFTRGVSEQRSRMPDYGVTDQGQPGKPRTATENNRIAALQDVGADHNGEIMRSIRLPKIYKHAWALVCHREEMLRLQGKPSPLIYFVADNLKTLPAQALHDQYLVIPSGVAGTKDKRLAKAGARYTLFKGAPNIDQDELARSYLAEDDSRLIKKLLRPGNQRMQSEYLDQVIKINAGLAGGFPVPVFPDEDQATRIIACVDWMHGKAALGVPHDPQAMKLVMGQVQARFQLLQQQNPQAAKQLQMQLKQKFSQQQQQGQMPGQAPQPQIGSGAEQPQPQEQLA